MTLFNQHDKLEDLFLDIKKKIEEEINSSGRDYILNVDVKEYCEFLKSKYELDSVELLYDEKYQLDPSETTKSKRHPIFPTYIDVPAAYYTIVIPISGDGNLLYKKPNLTIMARTPEGIVENNELHLYFLIAEGVRFLIRFRAVII